MTENSDNGTWILQYNNCVFIIKIFHKPALYFLLSIWILESISFEQLSKGFNESESDENGIQVDHNGSNKRIFHLRAQALSNNDELGIIDQVETKNDDAQSKEDQVEEGKVGSDKESEVWEQSASEDIDGTTEESQVQSSSQSVEEEWDAEDEDWWDEKEQDSSSVREVGEVVSKEGSEQDVNDHIDWGLSEPVSSEVNNQDKEELEDTEGDAESKVALDPSDSVGFTGDDTHGDDRDKELDSEEGVELSQEDDSGGGTLVKEFVTIR